MGVARRRRFPLGQEFSLPLDFLSLLVDPLLLPAKTERRDREEFNSGYGRRHRQNVWTVSRRLLLDKVLEGVSVGPLLGERRSVPHGGEMS